ncbi:sugar ABC transporter substrate-binding protein [Glycomyces sp. L485]|uniref:ABC transporter substrate-binding protein n=1 Tax=Glycomyces sp. L485 TaxID=2909235 RepID=UPI001F4ABDB3|nr:sugar ABC transporter substrate-binding protein [Glycomyces sp. L485]MCH7230524.1 sugar ABC transporter substrate-binding protein [Glycomyces sp. L485]
MRKTRMAAAAALAVAAPAGLAACGGGDDGNVTLRYAFWDDNQRPAVEAMIDAFNEDHPDITVELEQNPWDDYWTALDTQLAAQSAPDVFWNHVSKFPTFADQDVLLPITEQIDQAGLDTSAYPAALYDSWAYDGEQYGLPKDWDSIALVYRIDALEAAGIDPAEIEDLEWNPDDGGSYVEFLQRLTIDADGDNALSPEFDPDNVEQYGVAMSSSTGQTDWWNYGVQNGCELQPGPFEEYTLDTPECVEAIQFTADLYNRWQVAVPATSSNQPNGGLTYEFVSAGQSATATDGSWTLSAYRDGLDEGNLAVGPLPAGPAGDGTVINGLSHAIYAGTEHPDEAWELVEFLGSEEAQRIATDLGSVWPGVSSLNQGFTDYWAGEGVDVSGFQTAAEGPNIGYPLSLNDSVYAQIAMEEFNEVWLGSRDAQEAATTVAETANAG